ncbi:MAG: hypothetical protein FJ087_14755 [Deltaproteobacteria bacterium]|nr:hypothetical protein [Deltaproteobacteria bacterium]
MSERDWSTRSAWTFLIGEYLAVNAIRDAYMLVEGPDCVHLKTQFVQGNHDWMSTLTSVSGHHRVANTALHPVQMARSREEVILEVLRRIATHPATGGVLMTAMPMAAVTGADYDGMCKVVAGESGKPVVQVPGRSLGGDWLDGYAEALAALARRLDLPAGRADPRKVALVGYLCDRNEGDHRANLRDLRALVSALDLDVCSVWLENQAFADLAAVAEAATIVSLPYGRKAATWVAKRTGARVVECDVPLGPSATERLVRAVASATGRESLAEARIEAELARCVPPLEWVVPFVFQDRVVGFVGDPHLAAGVADVVELLGARLAFAALTGREAHCAAARSVLAGRAAVLENPRAQKLADFLESSVVADPIDLLVTNEAAVNLLPDVARIELGFPSLYRHELYDRPYLGFGGFLALASDMANALRRQDAARGRAAGYRLREGG